VNEIHAFGLPISYHCLIKSEKERRHFMTRTDIAIIGTGPAGLEAALTAKNRNKTTAVFGSLNLSNKMQVIDHPITNYLGLKNVTGKEMADIFRDQIKEAGIAITEQKVTAVYAMGEYFTLQLSNGEDAEADTVILAAGVTAGKPYPGESEFLGRGVSYCATCDAPLYKGKKVIVIAGSAEEEAEADFLGEVCSDVTYIPLYSSAPTFSHSNIRIVHERPLEITGAMKAQALKTDQSIIEADCIFILREAQFPGQLVPGLNTEGAAVITDRAMRTNIPGLFAAGDIAGLPYQFIKSAGEGNIAAISAAAYLDQKKREAGSRK
jgi:thioredoxin reductase (NADPH)